MLRRDRFWWSLFAMAVVSLGIGFTQVFAPGFVLQLALPQTTPLSEHFVTSLGVMIVVFSLMFLFAITDETPQHVAVLWTGIQKLCSAIAVGIGVQHATLVAPAVAFALFDLIAGSMIIAYWYGLRQASNEIRVRDEGRSNPR